MINIKASFFPVLLLVLISTGLCCCGEPDSDKAEVIPDNDVLQVEESVASKVNDLPDKVIKMMDQESLEGTGNDIGSVGSSGMPVAEKPIMPGAVDNSAPEIIEIFSPAFGEHKRGPVKLNHLGHIAVYNVSCTDCHHDYQDGKNVWFPTAPVASCASCHDPEENKGDVKKLQTAYHNNCKHCHKELVEAGKSEDAPYKKCGDCHEDKD